VPVTFTLDLRRLAVPVEGATVREILDAALTRFITCEVQEVLEAVNERANCGRLAIYIHEAAKAQNLPAEYVVDVEYNRKQNGEIKTILNHRLEVIRVNCDVILHSRGAVTEQDNLLAIEMKKIDQPLRSKESDRERLQALTRQNVEGMWPADGKTSPEHVCGYLLGAFIELDRDGRTCNVEYYEDGALNETVAYPF
jgi:hypothetical protein